MSTVPARITRNSGGREDWIERRTIPVQRFTHYRWSRMSNGPARQQDVSWVIFHHLQVSSHWSRAISGWLSGFLHSITRQHWKLVSLPCRAASWTVPGPMTQLPAFPTLSRERGGPLPRLCLPLLQTFNLCCQLLDSLGELVNLADL